MNLQSFDMYYMYLILFSLLLVHSHLVQCSWGNLLQAIHKDSCCLLSCIGSRTHVRCARAELRGSPRGFRGGQLHSIVVPPLFPGGMASIPRRSPRGFLVVIFIPSSFRPLFPGEMASNPRGSPRGFRGGQLHSIVVPPAVSRWNGFNFSYYGFKPFQIASYQTARILLALSVYAVQYCRSDLCKALGTGLRLAWAAWSLIPCNVM